MNNNFKEEIKMHGVIDHLLKLLKTEEEKAQFLKISEALVNEYQELIDNNINDMLKQKEEKEKKDERNR